MDVQKMELVVGDIKGNREIAYALLTATQAYFVNQNVIEEEGKLTIESLLTDECPLAPSRCMRYRALRDRKSVV